MVLNITSPLYFLALYVLPSAVLFLTFFYIETKHSVAIVTGQRVPKMIEKESSKLKFSRKSLFLLLACHGWILFQNQKHLMAESQYG